MHRKKTGISGPDELLVRDLFTFGNAKNNINAEGIQREENQLALRTVQLNYGGYFIDGTFRNDWSSTLHPITARSSIRRSAHRCDQRYGQQPRQWNARLVYIRKVRCLKVGNDLIPISFTTPTDW